MKETDGSNIVEFRSNYRVEADDVDYMIGRLHHFSSDSMETTTKARDLIHKSPVLMNRLGGLYNMLRLEDETANFRSEDLHASPFVCGYLAFVGRWIFIRN